MLYILYPFIMLGSNIVSDLINIYGEINDSNINLLISAELFINLTFCGLMVMNYFAICDPKIKKNDGYQYYQSVDDYMKSFCSAQIITSIFQFAFKFAILKEIDFVAENNNVHNGYDLYSYSQPLCYFAVIKVIELSFTLLVTLMCLEIWCVTSNERPDRLHWHC